MAKRTRRFWHCPHEDQAAIHRPLQPDLPEPVYEALRKIAFDERLKIHDVVLEGIDLALRRRLSRISRVGSRGRAVGGVTERSSSAFNQDVDFTTKHCEVDGFGQKRLRAVL
jgi:hypothetical protein